MTAILRLQDSMDCFKQHVIISDINVALQSTILPGATLNSTSLLRQHCWLPISTPGHPYILHSLEIPGAQLPSSTPDRSNMLCLLKFRRPDYLLSKYILFSFEFQNSDCLEVQCTPGHTHTHVYTHICTHTYRQVHIVYPHTTWGLEYQAYSGRGQSISIVTPLFIRTLSCERQ